MPEGATAAKAEAGTGVRSPPEMIVVGCVDEVVLGAGASVGVPSVAPLVVLGDVNAGAGFVIVVEP